MLNLLSRHLISASHTALNLPIGAVRLFSTGSDKLQQLFVNNLNYAATPDDLGQLFGSYNPQQIELLLRPGRGHTSGSAVVTLSQDAAQKALDELMMKEFMGRKLFLVKYDKPKAGKHSLVPWRLGQPRPIPLKEKTQQKTAGTTSSPAPTSAVPTAADTPASAAPPPASVSPQAPASSTPAQPATTSMPVAPTPEPATATAAAAQAPAADPMPQAPAAAPMPQAPASISEVASSVGTHATTSTHEPPTTQAATSDAGPTKAKQQAAPSAPTNSDATATQAAKQ